MATQYPASIDNNTTLPLVNNNITPFSEEIINNLRNAIVAVEAELGVKPSGIYSTVRNRLDYLEATGGGGSGVSIVPVSAVVTSGSIYYVNTSDYIIPVDSKDGPVTINLLNSPENGRTYIIKDIAGFSDIYNIIISATNIDNSIAYYLAIPYGSVTLVFNSEKSQWMII